jgi:hypothetical protein
LFGFRLVHWFEFSHLPTCGFCFLPPPPNDEKTIYDGSEKMKTEAMEKLKTRTAEAEDKAKQLKARLQKAENRTRREAAAAKRKALDELKYQIGGEVLSRGRQVEATVKAVIAKVENAERRKRLEQAFDDFMFLKMKEENTTNA